MTGVGSMKKLDLSITVTTNKQENLYNSIRLKDGREDYMVKVLFMINAYKNGLYNTVDFIAVNFKFSKYADVLRFSTVISYAYEYEKMFNGIELKNIDNIIYEMRNAVDESSNSRCSAYDIIKAVKEKLK